MTAIIPQAESVKRAVENPDYLTDADVLEVFDRIARAVSNGQRKTSIRYDRNDKRLWPMKSRLDSLGYKTIVRETPYGSNLTWSW